MIDAVTARPRSEAGRCVRRALTWAGTDDRVLAVIVYGSVARGTDADGSDLDLLVVVSTGFRDSVWAQREDIAGAVLGCGVAFAHEAFWQRPYRYQAWAPNWTTMVDPTLEEDHASPWRGLAEGHVVLLDRQRVAERLSRDLAAWTPEPHDALAQDAHAWPWLGRLARQLDKHRYWSVHAGLITFLDQVVVPLLGVDPDQVDTRLNADQRAALMAATPSVASEPELRRALLAGADLYDIALAGWASASGESRPAHPLRAPVRERLSRTGHR